MQGNLSDEVMLLHGFEAKDCHKSLNKNQERIMRAMVIKVGAGIAHAIN